MAAELAAPVAMQVVDGDGGETGKVTLPPLIPVETLAFVDPVVPPRCPAASSLLFQTPAEYVAELGRRFQTQPNVISQFAQILTALDSGEIMLRGAKQRVMELFRYEHDLVFNFNIYLAESEGISAEEFKAHCRSHPNSVARKVPAPVRVVRRRKAGNDDDDEYVQPKPKKQAGRGRKRKRGGSKAGGTVVGPVATVKRQKKAKSGVIPRLPRNSDGSFTLPLSINGTTRIVSLGKIKWDHPAYYSNRYIYPVGFHSVKTYHSTYDINARSDYHCRITAGPKGPVFVVTENDEGTGDSASTATGAFNRTVELVNKLRGSDMRVSGPGHYGLSHNITRYLIQKMPGAKKCAGYTFAEIYEEGDAPKSKQTTLKRKSR